jgi:hypothetical protein
MAEIAPIGMLDEHAPRNTDNSGPAEYNPSPDETAAIKLAQSLFERAKTHRGQYDQKWLDYYKMFRGKQWKEQRPSYRHSEVINLVFRTIQSLVPIQVDARPRFEFLPQEPSDMEFASILNQLAEADWTKKNWSEQLLEVIYDSTIYGTGISKTVSPRPFSRVTTFSIAFRTLTPATRTKIAGISSMRPLPTSGF